nr:MAG TPA: hypothetical protein [Caudoviricetes sp.]
MILHYLLCILDYYQFLLKRIPCLEFLICMRLYNILYLCALRSF